MATTYCLKYSTYVQPTGWLRISSTHSAGPLVAAFETMLGWLWLGNWLIGEFLEVEQ